ncbi:granzyme G-like isoform X2 [Dicentrarchus labrax]|uniref:granzyme G-like isoform X1 n=1 Tax=Dicentrarchus labrax TaxID=13489 RepID=UPI00162F65A9|nr:granzyme G-like isoform X1 [Dicentrarchus labrax]XP_051233211.1 granzyme G-like isoform X2 [Dicentrarchus labrax]
MFIPCKLVILILALTLDGQVHTGENIGGREAVPHSRPYMVLLKRHMQDGKTLWCGGFLLNEDFVMTTAHCQARSYTVFLGVHNFRESNGVQRIRAEQAFPHKDYNSTSRENDIMLLKLSSKVDFSKNVKPIALADRDDDFLPESCSISGWGRTDRETQYMSLVLVEADVTLIVDEWCQRGNFYCSEGETGPSEGDSGGSLVCEDGKAYGVVSFTLKPNSGGPFIHGYTKIADRRRQIDLTNDASKGSYYCQI